MIVEAEYDLEKYTNYDFEKSGGRQQQQQQQQQQQPRGRVDGKYTAGQGCRFGVACNDPKCRSIMTHKDKDGGMQKTRRFGHGCRDKGKGCKDWHPRWPKAYETNTTNTSKGKGGGKGGRRQVKTDLEEAKMAYSREKKVSVRTVEDSNGSGELAKWLQKYEETQKKVQMHSMSQQGGRAYLESNNELMEVPTPNVFSVQSQEPRWYDFSSQPISVAYSAYSNPPSIWVITPTGYITRSEDHDYIHTVCNRCVSKKATSNGGWGQGS